jgi:hypothetical protein
MVALRIRIVLPLLLAIGVAAGPAGGQDLPGGLPPEIDLPPAELPDNALPPGAPIIIKGKKLQGVAPSGLLAPDDSDWSGLGALVPAGTVRMINRATAKLGFAFYDMAAWQVVRLDPKRQAEIGCRRCEAIVHVQFHDGREAKRFTLDLEHEYVIGWSNEVGSWVIRPAQ